MRVGAGPAVNRADLLLSCLRDGTPWTRYDIYEHVGEFFLTNNAAAELRERGFDVQHMRQGRLDVYQLVNGSLGEREQGSSGSASEPVSPRRGVVDNRALVSRSPSDSLTISEPEPQPRDVGSAAHSGPRPSGSEQLSLVEAA